MTLGVTYSTFGDDNLGGSIYNTGNRYISQFGFNNTYGPGQVNLAGWDLFRTSGTIAGGTTLGQENIGNGSLSYALAAGGLVFEPNVEGRFWTQDGAATSGLATFGLRMQIGIGGLMFMPGFGYSVGQIAAQDASGANITQTLTGLHGTLAIRLR